MDDSYYRAGAGDPIVLLNGITSSWHVWKPVIPALAASHEVIAMTLPGHLGWPWPASAEHSIEAMADLVADRIAELGVTRPHLVGNSLGGWVSLELASRGLARSVTAFSPAGGWTMPIDVSPMFLPVQERVAELRAAAEEILEDDDRRRRLLTPYMERGDRMPLAEAVRAWDAVLAVETLPEMVKVLSDPRRSDVPDAVPVSIVWGKPDRLLPEDFGAPGWRESAPSAVWSHIDGGHTPMYDDPDAMVRSIQETVART